MVTAPLNYNDLRKDFIAINILLVVSGFVMFLYIMLQKFDVIPTMPCMMHDALRIYCPGCGGTRALFALLHGDILQSLYCNPAILMGLGWFLHYEIGVVRTLCKKDGKRYYCTAYAPWVVCGVVLLIFYVVRNYLLIAVGFDMLQDFIPR